MIICMPNNLLSCLICEISDYSLYQSLNEGRVRHFSQLDISCDIHINTFHHEWIRSASDPSDLKIYRHILFAEQYECISYTSARPKTKAPCFCFSREVDLDDRQNWNRRDNFIPRNNPLNHILTMALFAISDVIWLRFRLAHFKTHFQFNVK